MSGIYWLASYPKSGNTWLRAFLSNVTQTSDQPAAINELRANIASSRSLVDELLSIGTSDMTYREAEALRPEAYRRLCRNSSSPHYLKAHDAYTRTATGEPLFPADASAGVVYVVRNPLDIAVSFSHHNRQSVDEIIALMENDNASLSATPGRLRSQLRQRLLTWSGHVRSWLDQSAIPLHLIRYEDMHLRPHQTFLSVIRFLNLPELQDRIELAVRNSDFAELRRQEQVKGFRERPAAAKEFFRSGKAGQWKHVLTPEQIGRVLSAHAPVMRRVGYVEGDPAHA